VATTEEITAYFESLEDVSAQEVPDKVQELLNRYDENKDGKIE